jgi:hypothetical protein
LTPPAETKTAAPAPPTPPAAEPPPAPPPAAAAPPPAPAPAPFKHRRDLSTDDLCRQLLAVPELDLDSIPGSSGKLLSGARTNPGTAPHIAPDLLVKRAERDGLPLRMGLECQLGKESAENLQVLSRKLRIYLAGSVPQDGIDTRPDPLALRRKLLDGRDGERGDWQQPEAVPTLTQLLQAEDKPLRLLLVEFLARIKGPAASRALAQRALFDLSDGVREAAVTALRDRPRDDYHRLLLDGFRYPWAPVADHAAEALVALRDRESLPELVRLLDQPDPSLPAFPTRPDGRLGHAVVREVVRVNHLKNCVMCHAPSLEPDEPVRGLVPTPGQPVPPSFTPRYYQATTGIFVRADVTYLKQDFSVPQPVARPNAWPASQRFDYLVRTRPATFADLTAAVDKSAGYPQREAVLFALRELTGKDAGPTALGWQSVLALARDPGRMEREP